ncbi:MAG: ABC transporter substrate-binding protein [Desulfobacteraceae bacterium]|nr:ABC transporter substrate-binding protein [Desulfobacteraceae bacterium]
MNIIYISSFISIFFLLFAGPQAAATDEYHVVIAAANHPPSSGETLPDNGFMAKLVTDAFKQEGYTVVYNFYPWKRALEETINGDVDGLLTVSYSDERAQHLQYSDVVHQFRINFLTTRDKQIAYKSPSDMRPYLIGVIRGTVFIKGLEENGIRYEEVKNWEMNLNKLLYGRVDAVLGNTVNVQYSLEQKFGDADRSNIVVVEPPYTVDDVHVAFSKRIERTELLVNVFNRGLSKIKNDGTYASILKKHHITE